MHIFMNTFGNRSIQQVHLLGVSANVTWVTSQGPCGEHVHQSNTTISGHNAQNFGHVSRQPALPRQAVCTQIVVGRLKCYHPSMKWI